MKVRKQEKESKSKKPNGKKTREELEADWENKIENLVGEIEDHNSIV